MMSARRLIDEARDHLERVRQRLLYPSADVLENAMAELEQAIGLLRQGEVILSNSTSNSTPNSTPNSTKMAESSGAWESALQLRRELARVNSLAKHANTFYLSKVRQWPGQDLSVSYRANGAASLPAERHSEKNLVLHG